MDDGAAEDAAAGEAAAADGGVEDAALEEDILADGAGAEPAMGADAAFVLDAAAGDGFSLDLAICGFVSGVAVLLVAGDG